MRPRWGIVAGLLLAAAPVPAQHPEPVGAGRTPRPNPASCRSIDIVPDRAFRSQVGRFDSPTGSAGAGCVETPRQATSQGRGSAWPIAASLVLPGSGQAMLSSGRAIAFLAVEAFGWTEYVRHAQDRRRFRDRYRDLAARVARSPFATVRPFGDFEYYERMTHYRESGRYDIVAGGELDPETDSLTFNGATWLLARQTFWQDPGTPPPVESPQWERAMEFYRDRAYDQTFRWSWTGADAEYSRFQGLIQSSNSSSRLALQNLGLVIANHLLSSVDSYVTLRVRHGGTRSGFGVVGSIPVGR